MRKLLSHLRCLQIGSSKKVSKEVRIAVAKIFVIKQRVKRKR